VCKIFLRYQVLGFVQNLVLGPDTSPNRDDSQKGMSAAHADVSLLDGKRDQWPVGQTKVRLWLPYPTSHWSHPTASIPENTWPIKNFWARTASVIEPPRGVSPTQI
jgi:hypothetical protein